MGSLGAVGPAVSPVEAGDPVNTTTTRTNTTDHIWQEALELAVQSGSASPSAVSAIKTEHTRLAREQAQRRNSRRILEILGYSGGLLVIVGGLTVASALLQDDSALWAATMMVLTVCLTAVAILVAATGSGGMRGVKELAARRRVTGTLVVAAGICASLSVMMLAESSTDSADAAWPILAFAVVVLFASAGTWLAPGAVPTVAVVLGGGGVWLTTAHWLGWDQPVWAFGAWLVGYSAVVGLLLVWLLVPKALVEALAVAGWLVGSFQIFVVAETSGVNAVDTAHNLGRFSLAMLIVLGVARYLRGGNWPWAAAVVLALPLWWQAEFGEELGAGLAILAAGLLLAGSSAALALLRRHRDSVASAPGSDESSASEAPVDESLAP